MKLIIESCDGSIERKILLGLILNKAILSRVSSKWNGNLFRSFVANVIGSLCVDFYKRYGNAPEKAIDALYEEWRNSERNQERAELVGDLLQQLSSEYYHFSEELNSDLIIDLAGKYFQEVGQEKLKEEIESLISAKNFDKVEQVIASYRKIELGIGSGIDLFTDFEEIKSTFAETTSDVLVQYPGALGEFFGFDLSRDSLVAFTGTAKSGKSFWIQDIAWRGMLNRKKVAYFEAGDLSKKQVIMRFMVRASARPYRSTNLKQPYWPCDVTIPEEMEVVKGEKSGKKRGYVTKSKVKTFIKPLDFEKAKQACEKVMMNNVKSKNSYFKLSVHPTATLSLDMIRTSLENYAVDNWYPDIIVVDYPDIMAKSKYSKDDRESINTIWENLRRLSQEYHCLIVIATQSDADGYKQETLDKGNFSGDRRKNDHVTAMYGINSSDEERSRGIIRLNVMARREGVYNSKKCIHVAQCIPIGNPAVVSSF